MENTISNKIDHLISQIKAKCDSFGATSADVFIVLTFEFLRYEVLLNRISEYTISAVSEIYSRTSHVQYYRDYRDIYNSIGLLYVDIGKFDERFYNLDIISNKEVNFDINSWQKYVSETSSRLLVEFPNSYAP